MTTYEYNAHLARQRQAPPEVGERIKDSTGEAMLHEQIFAECRRRGWIALHGAMSERTARTLGEPDFIILGNAERALRTPHGSEYFKDVPFVLFIECKTRTGKLSPAQLALHAHAAKLGHVVHVVRRFAEFLKLL